MNTEISSSITSFIVLFVILYLFIKIFDDPGKSIFPIIALLLLFTASSSFVHNITMVANQKPTKTDRQISAYTYNISPVVMILGIVTALFNFVI